MMKPMWDASVEAANSLISFTGAKNISDEDAESGSALSPSTLLRKREELSNTLPIELINAFNNEPLESLDIRFVGREAELAVLTEALQDWRNNRASLTALTGPHGSGITTLLNQLRAMVTPAETLSYLSLADRPCSATEALKAFNAIFDFDIPPETVVEAVQAINALPRRIIVIDDAHMLLSRKMGNLAAVQAFGAVLVATQHHHCWIIGCAKQAWRRLSFLYQCDKYFKRLIEIDYFGAEPLAEIIERRFDGLGYQWQERVGLSEDSSDPMKSRFKRLHDLSSGLPEMAFFFLLYAMEIEPSSKAISLQPFSKLDTAIIKDCNEDELFSLAEIYIHGVLGHVDHEILFRLNPEQSLLRLERLCRIGILHRIATNKHYTSNSYYLSPILAQAMVAHLVVSNKLY